ncbi:MAG: YraN family protein [Solirubrobacterales bacterium]
MTRRPLGNPQAARARGALAETLAVWWLRLKGYRILARRVVTGRGTGAGEVDIVARRGRLVAFVEVKARGGLTEALEAVTVAQRRRIARGAEAFLAQRPELRGCGVRFDVVLVTPRRFPCHISDAWRMDA